jgi:hypothetical protein
LALIDPSHSPESRPAATRSLTPRGLLLLLLLDVLLLLVQ